VSTSITNEVNSFVVPKRVVWSALALLVVVPFSWLQLVGYIIPGFKELFDFSLDTLDTMTIYHVGLIWVPFVTYGLVSLISYLSVSLFKEPKSLGERGLLNALAWSPFIKLLCGVILAILGIILGFWQGGLPWIGLAGFITGLWAGLVINSTFLLLGGLSDEFNLY